MKFGAYLRECRMCSHLSQEEFVDAFFKFNPGFKSLTVNTLSRWERGVNIPSDKSKSKIILVCQKINGVMYPYLKKGGVEIIQQAFDKASITKALGESNKEVLNFPNNVLSAESFKIWNIHEADKPDDIINYAYDLFVNNNDNFLDISKEVFTSWLLCPSNFCLVVSSNGQFMGVVISLRLKPESFEKLMNLDDTLKNINQDSFANFKEKGASLPLFLHASNGESAAYLILHYFTRLIDKQKFIGEVGMFNFKDQTAKFSKKLNLESFKEKEGVTSYKAPLSQVLSSGLILKMLF